MTVGVVVLIWCALFFIYNNVKLTPFSLRLHNAIITGARAHTYTRFIRSYSLHNTVIRIVWVFILCKLLLHFLQLWFTRLPLVLTFELSRFQFNQQTGCPEKIHQKLEFPDVIYMDRCVSLYFMHLKSLSRILDWRLFFLQINVSCDVLLTYICGECVIYWDMILFMSQEAFYL